MNVKKVNFENEKSLGYVVGTVAGDGYFCALPRRNFIIGMNVKDKDFADTFSDDLKALGLTVHLGLYNGFWCIRTNSKELHTYLENLNQKKITQNSTIFKRMFLRGLFDSDGWVIASNLNVPRKISRGIGLANNNKTLIDITSLLLTEFDIMSSIRGRVHSGFGSTKIQYELRIFGQENIEKFSRIIGFNIKRKQGKLDSILKSFRNEINCENCQEIVKLAKHQPAIKYCKACSAMKQKEYKKRYRKSPKAKEYNKIYSRKWREKNRAHYNEYKRQYKKRYRELKAAE